MIIKQIFVDAFSDKELREAEETILHHLNYCTQYKISEIQMFIVLRVSLIYVQIASSFTNSTLLPLRIL